MGNSQKPKRSQSLLKKTKSSQGTCLACMPNYESYEGSNLDNNELNIFKTFCQPKGKISPKSIAYLSKDEINFFKASAGRNISAIRYYLKKGVNVNTFDEDRTSPLHVAARHASIQVVEELLNWGALVDITDADGWTPLHVASFFQRPIVCHLLLKKGANSMIPNKDNARPSDLARDPKLREIFDIFFMKVKDGGSSSRRDKPVHGAFSARSHHPETDADAKIEAPYEYDVGHKFISQYSPEILSHQKYVSLDSLGITEEPARLPNLILPKQHKYYLYFKNLRGKGGTGTFKDNVTSENLNALTINSLSFSNDEPDDFQANYLENQSEISSVMFCDDSQIGDAEETGKNLALNFQINKSSKLKHSHPKKPSLITSSLINKPQLLNEYLHIKQNISFKLKNVYTSSLSVKKGLKFQVNSSHVTAGKRGTNQEKAQLPPKSNFKPAATVDFGASRNVAHYNKNPLTSNKPSKPQISYTPDSSRSILFVDNKVISLKEFVKEIIYVQIEELNNKKEKVKRNWVDHNLPLEPNFQRMVEVGIEMFNMQPICGISYIIFIKHIKNTPPAIAKFLHNQRTLDDKTKLGPQGSKKDKKQITAFLTNLNIKEILEILNFYTEYFIFRDMSFISALKFFLNNFIIENDPEKIDLLLYAFSRKYFKELKKIPNKEKMHDDQEYLRKIFQNFDAVHMLAFATIMLDIEIHHVKRKDLENVIKEFNANVKGLNDGDNFPKEFIDSLVENVLAQKVVVLSEAEEKKRNESKEKENSLRTNIMQDASLVLVVKKRRDNITKNGTFQLAMIENLGFLFRSNEEMPVVVFILENCNIKVKGLSFSLVANEKKANKLIIYGKFIDHENGTISVKYKENMEFLLIDSNDSRKIVKYVEKINEAKQK